MEATTAGRRHPWLRRKFRRWRRVAGEVRRGEGPRRLLVRGLVVVVGAVYRHVVFVTVDLSRPLPEAHTDVPLAFRLLRPEDAEAYARFRAEPAGAMPGIGRLAKGDVCVTAWLDDEIVSVGWISLERGWVDEIGRGLELASDEAYVYDSYTAERLRGRGVAGARALWAAAYLRDAGYRRFVGWISPQNRPAFGPARKAGYRKLGIAGFIRLGPWRRDFVHPMEGRRRWAARVEPIRIERDFTVSGSLPEADLPERRRA